MGTTTGPLSGDRAPQPEHVPLDQTTLPRYPVPVLDPAPHLVVVTGDGAGAATALLRDRPAGHDRWCATPDAVAPALSELVTGWRVLAVGPERDVAAVRSAALAAGALDEEVVLVATDAADPQGTRVRPLFCGACHHRFDARVAVGDPVDCPSCRAALTVAAHHSRRHGAFLGAPTGRVVPR